MCKTISFLRSLLFAAGQVLSAVVLATIGIALFAFPYSLRYKVITSWSHFIIWWVKWSCGVKYEIRGLEHLPQKNAIVLCKHQSSWETLFLQTILGQQTWVLKKQLLQIPFFGWALRLIEPIAIDREKSSSVKGLLEQGKERLEKGRWVVIFPEGSRIAVGKSGRYSRSGAVLAKETGYSIVPIAHNAGTLWPRGSFIKTPGTINVVIGPEIKAQGLTIDEIHEKAKRWIEDTMTTL
ncbi:MAG: lysophospholipid acyltransferase family protein [Candidatus Berkiella sp.]